MKFQIPTNDLFTSKRLTVSLPGYVYQQLLANVPKGTTSKFVTRALQESLGKLVTSDPVSDFLELRKKLPKRSTAQILRAIHQGRT